MSFCDSFIYLKVAYSFAKSYGDTIQEKRYREALNVGCEDQKRKNPATAVVLGLYQTAKIIR